MEDRYRSFHQRCTQFLLILFAFFITSTPAQIPVVTIDSIVGMALLPVDAHASISGIVNSHGNCTYMNGNPLCLGALVPVEGCSVSVFVPKLSVTMKTITDNSGAYSLDSIPLVENGDTFTIVASAGPGYSFGRQNLVLYNTQAYAVNFNLEIAYTNRAIKTNDSLEFTVSTVKKEYFPGDSIRVRYSVKNTTGRAIDYTFTPGCQYDWVLKGIKGDSIYQYMENRMCVAMIAFGTLNPSQVISMDFPGYAATSAMDSVLTVIAKTFSFLKSDVSIGIIIKKAATGILQVPAQKAPFFSSRAQLVAKSDNFYLILASAERVSLCLYDLTGRKITQVLNRQFLSAGEHPIQLTGKRLSHSMYLVRVTGETFAMARMIGIMR